MARSDIRVAGMVKIGVDQGFTWQQPMLCVERHGGSFEEIFLFSSWGLRKMEMISKGRDL